jgi:L-threonylcarbamoyladenylate synthase
VIDVVATPVLRIDPVCPDARTLGAAAAILVEGGVVAFPTETFYGLGARASRVAAVARVFAVKGRPRSQPLLVLVDSVAMVESLAREVSGTARRLMQAHWPGALTLVLPARASVPDSLTAGTATIGVRWPSHAVAVGLVRAVGEPITAPSANPSGAPPPETAAQVLGYFDDALDLVLDGGPTAGGAPSTVLDVTVEPPRVLRRGAVVVGG